jgi:uncharacterized protein
VQVPNQSSPRPEDLCLNCGLCCNGVIFADVKLVPEDNSARLRSLGLPLRAYSENAVLRPERDRSPVAALSKAAAGPLRAGTVRARPAFSKHGLKQPAGSSPRATKESMGVQAWNFHQPCFAFDGCRCRIYSERPSYCREFDCLLLKKARRRLITRASALRMIRAARRRADKVRRLLTELGDDDEAIALAERFRRTTKRLRRAGAGPQTAELYGRLTLAFHELNLTLSRSFYPGPIEP